MPRQVRFAGGAARFVGGAVLADLSNVWGWASILLAVVLRVELQELQECQAHRVGGVRRGCSVAACRPVLPVPRY